MFKIYKYFNLTKLPSVMVLRHSACGGGSMNKCSENCPQDQPKPVDCTAYECIRRKKIQVVEPPSDSPIHPFLKCPPPSNPNLWRNIFFFLCFPTIIGLFLHTMYAEEKFMRPKYVDFSYLRIRRNGYPWDPVRTLFHNPRGNALPGGYEIEVPEDEEYDPFSVM